ncbi:MAG: GFA family protein [Rhodanobacteraceae bacterium]
MAEPFDSSELVTHRGGCHCRRVRFEVDAPARPRVQECNCSICRMTGYLHLIVPAAHFRLLRGEQDLAEYRFNTGSARHLFCAHCGVKSFYVPRSHPHGYSVNLRCLDEGTLEAYDLSPFDDNDREASMTSIAHLAD